MVDEPEPPQRPRGSWYERRVFHPLMDRVLSTEAVRAERHATLAPARGRTLEVGFGTGLNVPHLPAEVTALVGLTRDPALPAVAAQRVAARGLAFEHAIGDAHALPFDAGEFDTVVCTLLLCSVGDPERVVRELLRVLRPGGRLLVLEHVRASGRLERAAQRVLQPVQRLVACGCRLDLDAAAVVRAAGGAWDTLAAYRTPAFPPPFAPVIRGVARRASG